MERIPYRQHSKGADGTISLSPIAIMIQTMCNLYRSWETSTGQHTGSARREEVTGCNESDDWLYPAV